MVTRTWLHPRWYEAQIGPNEVIATANRETLSIHPADTPDPICTKCGANCITGGYDIDPSKPHKWGPEWDKGYLCYSCAEDLPQRTPSLIYRLWDRADSRLDRLYWWYCERYGERVPL